MFSSWDEKMVNKHLLPKFKILPECNLETLSIYKDKYFVCSNVLVDRTYQQPLILQRGAASWWIFHISARRDLTLGPPITHCDASCDGPLDACKSETFWLPWEKNKVNQKEDLLLVLKNV